MEHTISDEKRRKIYEFNERCRLKNLLESVSGQSVVNENVVVMINGMLIDMPKVYAEKQSWD